MASTSFFFCLQLSCLALAISGTRAQWGGSWELLVQNAGIAAMHAAVTRFNTVVLLDRTDTGPSQINLPNGQYRNDSSDQALTKDYTAHSVVLDLATNTVRPLMILTDTWCSSGQFLPNGSLLQSGGWNDGSNKFRIFDPCVSTGSCDWYEFPSTTELFQPRWYASNQVLPDGTIIIVGGIGVNSVEYYPRRSDRAVDFPFLAQMADNEGDNLYPYVHLLPNGYLFIFANTQYVLYDYNSDTYISENLPSLPGGPRNYPSAGSSVMLALEGSYSSATIVICGGAQYDAFNNQNITAPAKNSCGRIVPTDPNPTWEIEYMPFGRIMGEMVMLPTGNVVIISGAKAGSQGFGLATDACLTPVLYQPNNPMGKRFTELASGSIPRVYHSTANLLPDARILLAGSNTQWGYTFTGVPFPTELRIDAFTPPYLPTLNFRPKVLWVSETVLKYNQGFVVSVTVPFLKHIVEVNLASAPYSTHSFSQGQRLIKLAANQLGGFGQSSIRCTAPPNGKVAPPGYYMMFVVVLGVPSEASWVQLTL